ncbi:MAG: hypothetical protein M3O70_10060, partial [Actinomycetota bacterium]|nr:hypothetical protein [Actinomycetota bacterium]
MAEQLGYHRTTIGKWLKAGGPPAKRATGPERVVLGVGLVRAAVVLWCDLVLGAVAAVVVYELCGSRAHLRGAGALLRSGRW